MKSYMFFSNNKVEVLVKKEAISVGETERQNIMNIRFELKFSLSLSIFFTNLMNRTESITLCFVYCYKFCLIWLERICEYNK